MAFRPVRNEIGTVLRGVANSTTVTRGNTLVDNGSGYLTNGASSTAVDVEFIAAETVTTTADNQQVLCWETRGGVEFDADCDAAPAQTDIGTDCDLATVSTLNPDASSNDLFRLTAINGVVGTSTVVRGYFNHGVPNS